MNSTAKNVIVKYAEYVINPIFSGNFYGILKPNEIVNININVTGLIPDNFIPNAVFWNTDEDPIQYDIINTYMFEAGGDKYIQQCVVGREDEYVYLYPDTFTTVVCGYELIIE